MPHSFFHHCIDNRMIWDRLGCELPVRWLAPDPSGARALWMDILSDRVLPDRITIITDELGKVLFTTMR